MEIGYINVTKVKYVFKDGNEVSGLELSLAPKVKKFIHINRDNADLLRIMNNGIIEWYNRADYGDDLVLKCSTNKDRTYIPDQNNGDIEVTIK